MKNPRFLSALGVLLTLSSSLFAETPEERAQKVTVTMELTDVPPGAVAHFVEVVSNIKIYYQGRPGDQTVLSVSFENTTADAALKYLAELARLELTYKPDGAYFTPLK